MSDSPLTDREELILQAVVQQYITNAEPVGSRAIVKRFDLDISPATVRNVMADLEESGYIHQLHTSSGRVPTDQGYRYYVDYLMRVQEVTLTEKAHIEHDLNKQLNNADTILKQTSNLLALITRQTGIVEIPNANVATIHRIELMPLGNEQLAMLVADNYGRVQTILLPWTNTLASDGLIHLNNFLNEHLKGTSIDALSSSISDKLQQFLDDQRKLAELSLNILSQIPQSGGQLYLNGATQLFEQPEFHDVDKAREVFGLLEERERVAELLRSGTIRNLDTSRIMIGSEDLKNGLDEISVVSAPYKIHDKTVGMIGVLGPRRMPYSKLTGIVEYTASKLGSMLTKLSR